MKTRALMEMYSNGLDAAKEEMEQFKRFKESDELAYAKSFFLDKSILEQLFDLYGLIDIDYKTAFESLDFNQDIEYKNGDSEQFFEINYGDPTPDASSLIESASQLLGFLKGMDDIEKMVQLDIRGIPEIVEAFFDRYKLLKYDIVVDNVKVLEFADGSKEDFLKSVTEFNDKIHKIKSDNPEVTKTINSLKVDLGSLIKNTKEEDSFDFRSKYDLAKQIAIKAKPALKFIVGVIGVASGVKALLA